MDKMRITKHSARAHKNGGVFNPNHNDRQYENNRKSRDKNEYWNLYDGLYSEDEKSSKLSFQEAEERYYRENFMEQYHATMERYINTGHKDRVKSFDEWRTAKQYAPEEIFYQIGNIDNHADEETFISCFNDYYDWETEWSAKHDKPFQILDMSVHMDEDVPQIHVRRVWQYRDATGNLSIGQNAALSAAGVQVPNPGEKRSRYNNRKQTFDKMCREKWIEICKSHGLDIEEQPLPDGTPHNLSKEEYIAKKWKKREAVLNKREAKLKDREAAIDAAEDRISRIESDLEAKRRNIQVLTENAEKRLLSVSEREKRVYEREIIVDKREKAEDLREKKNSVAIRTGRAVMANNKPITDNKGRGYELGY